MKQIVDIIGVSLKKPVGIRHHLRCDLSPSVHKHSFRKTNINVFRDTLQVYLFCTIVERFCSSAEHIFQDMTVTACIDKQTIIHSLDMCTQNGFDILLRIIGNLLKLVNGKDAGFVGLFQIAEDLFQRELRKMDVTQLDIESGSIGNRIIAKTSRQRMKTNQKFVEHTFSFRNQYRVYLLAKE